MLTITTNEKKR